MNNNEAPKTIQQIENWLIEQLAQRLAIDPSEIAINEPLENYGLSSRETIELSGDLEVWLNRTLEPTLVWEYPSIQALSGFLSGESETENEQQSEHYQDVDTIQKNTDAIAIIGLGCRFPGASNADHFWELLTQGKDAIQPIPEDRWCKEDWYNPDPHEPGKTITQQGGFLENIDLFDPLFFGINKREAHRIDPQQRLLLEVTWEALENAGIVPEHLQGSHTGVFIGVSTHDYSHIQLNAPPFIDAYAGTGNAHSIAANRISYSFDLQGPSVAIDTACSSSLVAMHFACQSLQTGESETAIVGGVNVVLAPTISINFTKAGAMAKDGRCKTFDARADGYVRSEGAGVVVLKPLSKAERDGDRIYAVIKSSAINQDGRTNGLMAPNPQAQEKVLAKAYNQAHIDPSRVQYIEAHGTGTFIGDPIEVQALQRVLCTHRQADHQLRIGSVKSNIGHLEAAAGIAGVIKTTLMLWHNTFVPSIHFETPNPHIDFGNNGIKVQQTVEPWNHTEEHIAGVSSFGFGGTNAHVVLGGYQNGSQAHTAEHVETQLQLLPLSAHRHESLIAQATNMIAFLERSEGVSIKDIGANLALRRTHHAHRLCIAACSKQEYIEYLQTFLNDGMRPGMSSSKVHYRTQPKVVFVFPGQGSQWIGMGQALYASSEPFRKAIEACDRALENHVNWSLTDMLLKTESAETLAQIHVIQPILWAIEIGLASVWQAWGVKPHAIIGHSMGEIAAAVIAGAISIEDGALIITQRSLLMQRLSGQGAMALVEISKEGAEQYIAPYQGEIVVAVSNSPKSTVLAGTPEALDTLLKHLDTQQIFCRRIKVDVASHSPFLAPLRDELTMRLIDIHPHSNSIPFISTVSAQELDGENLDSEYWVKNLLQPVKFAEAIDLLIQTEHHVFIELSPHPVLGSAINDCLEHAGIQGHVLASLKRDKPEQSMLLGALGQLYCLGYVLDWNYFYPEKSYPIQLPLYPYQRDRYWLEEAAAWLKTTTATAMNNQISLDGDTYMGMPQAETATRKAEILTTLRGIIARLLETDPSEVDINLPFLEMGADSIVIIEAVRRIQDVYPVELSVRQLFEDLSTLEILGEYIDHHLPHTPIKQSIQPVQPQQPPHSVSAVVAQPQPMVLVPTPGVQPQPLISSTAQVGQNTLEHVMSQQLQVVSQLFHHQLSILQGGQYTAQPLVGRPSIDEQQADVLPQNTQHTQSAIPVARKSDEAPYVPYKPITPGSAKIDNDVQQQHIETLIARFTQRTPKSKAIAGKYRSTLADSRAAVGFRLSIKEMLYPISGSKAKGAYFWDVDGNEYIDMTMGFGVHLFGHNPDFLVDTMTTQIEHGIPIGPRSEISGEVAQLFCELTGMERAAFFNSGTEAVMTALRLARAATKRTKICIFSGAYHGHSDGTLARKTLDDPLKAVPMSPGISPLVIEDVLVVDYGTPESLNIIQQHAHELAAVIVEPVQSRRPELQPKEFLHRLRAITAQSGTALIFDEMVTGFRIGVGGAQEHFGVQADLATYGKIIGGGMPIGVVAGSHRFMNGVDGGMWNYGDSSYPQAETTFVGGTFCLHPLAMATSLAVLKHIKQQGPALYQELNQKTARFARKLDQFFEAEQIPIQTTTFGSLFRFTFKGNRDLLFFHLLEKGIYIWEWRSCFVSTAHTDDDLDQVVERVKQSIYEMRQGGMLPDPHGHASTNQTARSNGSPKRSWGAAFAQQAPLTESQKQLWFLSQMGVEPLMAYTESIALELKGNLEIQLMHTVWKELVDRHEALRTTISADGADQYIHKTMNVSLATIDFSLVDDAEQEHIIDQWIQEESTTPFDLQQGPLLRITLLKREHKDYLFVLTVHHIVVDGWSVGILLQEMVTLYNSYTQGTKSELAEPLQFRAYIDWEQQQYITDAMQKKAQYWQAQYQDTIPVLNLPTDFARPRIKTYNGARLSIVIDEEITSGIKNIGRKNGSTLFITLIAAYMVLLHRITGQQDIVVGMPSSGRILEDSEYMVGHCVDLTPVRSKLQANPSFIEFLTTLKRTIFTAYEHQEYTFAALLKDLNPTRDLSRSPLIETSFNLERSIKLPDLEGLSSQVIFPSRSFVKFDLNLNVMQLENVLQVDFDYNTDLFTETTVQRFQSYFQEILRSIVENAEQRIVNISFMQKGEFIKLVNTWNQTGTDYLRDKSIIQLFEAQVDATPDAIALVFGQTSLTYKELHMKSNQLASLLQESGITLETPVGVCIERSMELIITILAILKAGGIYVPLDPNYPHERLKYMLNDAQLKIVLVQSHLYQQLPFHGLKAIIVDTVWNTLTTYSDASLGYIADASHLAYIMYTSGSTGKPKGIAIQQRSVVRLVKNTNYIDIQSTERFLQFAPSSFDASTFEIWGALLNGAELYIFPQHLPSLDELGTFITDKGITTLWLTAGLFHQMVENQISAFSDVNYLLAGGDVLSVVDVHKALEVINHGVLINGYGPTENTTFSCCFSMHKDTQIGGSVPIGKPIANTTVYVLDYQMEPVPVGIPGELYVGGDGLARGYINRPRQTALCFMPNPFSSHPGERLYKTGDIVRYREDGTLEFMGRKDEQLKIRGFRIELGEINAAIARYPGVRQWIVLSHEHAPGDKRLIVYLMANLAVDRISFEITCHLSYGMNSSATVTSDDISETGVCIKHIPEDLHVGQHVQLGIHLPGNASESIFKAVVIWIRDRKAGLSFDLAPEDQKLVRDGIKYIMTHEHLKMVDLHSGQFRVPFWSRCVVEYDGQREEIETERLMLNGLRVTGIPVYWQKQTGVRVYITLPGYDEGVWFNGSIDWIHNDKAGMSFELTQTEHVLMRQGMNYLIEREGFSVAHLRRFLQTQLPDYMVPSSFILMDALPLNANGKVDRQALPHPEEFSDKRKVVNVPRNDIEAKIAAVWSEILQVQKLSVDDNFFDVGGNSLLLTKLNSKLQTLFERSIPMVELFKHPTIRDQAHYLSIQPNNGENKLPADAVAPQNKAGKERLQRLKQLRQRSSS